MVSESLTATLMNVILAIIIACFIILFVTSGENDTNSLSALTGSYIGLFFCILFIIVLNFKNNYMEMLPFGILLAILFTIIWLLYYYFDRIASGEVSSYYGTFSSMSTKLLIIEMIIMLSAIYAPRKPGDTKIMSNQTLALLGLLGTINYIVVITLAIILHFYVTQG